MLRSLARMAAAVSVHSIWSRWATLPPMRDHMLAGEDDVVQYEFEHDALHAKLRRHFAFARKRGEVRWLRTAREARGHGLDTRPLEAGHRVSAATCADEDDGCEDEDEIIYDSEVSMDLDHDDDFE